MELPVLLDEFKHGNVRALARCISFVENEVPGYDILLTQLQPTKLSPVIGFTGAPGAGVQRPARHPLVGLRATAVLHVDAHLCEPTGGEDNRAVCARVHGPVARRAGGGRERSRAGPHAALLALDGGSACSRG